MIQFVSDKYTYEFVNVIRYALLFSTMPFSKCEKRRKIEKKKRILLIGEWYPLLTWFVLDAHPGTRLFVMAIDKIG